MVGHGAAFEPLGRMTPLLFARHWLQVYSGDVDAIVPGTLPATQLYACLPASVPTQLTSPTTTCLPPC